jgi:hypothetical protein
MVFLKFIVDNEGIAVQRRIKFLLPTKYSKISHFII